MQEMDIRYQEQIAILKQEKAALQSEADTIPALRAEISELQFKVSYFYIFEHSQHHLSYLSRLQNCPC